jgi:DnaJ-class molecular chaperone
MNTPWKVFLPFMTLVVVLVFAGPGRATPEAPKQDIVIRARPYTKLQPVPFSHATHVIERKIECAKCHHRDPADPKACTACHAVKERDRVPSSKEAFHNNCRTCHKEQVSWKCHDCHHRP